MRTAILSESGIEINKCPIPSPSDNELVIRVKKCAICGTDLLKNRNKTVTSEWGHEIIGERVDNGQPVTVRTTYPCGKCYLCNKGYPELCTNWARPVFSGFSDYIKVDKKCVIPLDGTDCTDAYILAEPLNVAINLVEHLSIRKTDSVAVIGSAGIALMAAIYARKTYNCQVSVFARSASSIREQVCVANEIMYVSVSTLKEKLADYNKIICTAPYEMIAKIVDFAGINSEIVFNGISDNAIIPVDLAAVHFKKLSLYGCFPHPQTGFKKAIEFIDNNVETMKTLITNSYSLDDIDSAFNLACGAEKEYIKIVIDME